MAAEKGEDRRRVVFSVAGKYLTHVKEKSQNYLLPFLLYLLILSDPNLTLQC